MNFFGHAAVASWSSGEPGFVLGAMLPDFFSMIRARPLEIDSDTLAEGVRFHHRTDSVFHDSVTFLRLSSGARSELSEQGLRRGSARAVAHIGVEILLDGWLASDARARSAYREALGAHPSFAPHLVWRTAAEKTSLGGLLRALEDRGVSREHAKPEIVTLRIERALAPRPRLALAPNEVPLVRAWAESARDHVADAGEELLLEMRAGLGMF